MKVDKLRIALVVALLNVAGCSARRQQETSSAMISNVTTATTAPSSARDVAPSPMITRHLVVYDDIAYRPGASKAWRLDLAMQEPAGDERRPAIVIIHGGGWRAGSKRDRAYRDLLMHYALKGYVTLSVDYRLTTEAPFPACIEDVKCAVRWLRAHADQYRVDPNRIGAYGHSAGAHLVMMLAMLPASVDVEGDGGWSEYSSKIQAAAGGSTPVTIRPGPNAPADPAKWSPMTYVSKDVPPILLISGTADNIVPVATNDEFVEKLKAAGATDVTYVRIDGGNHGVAYEFFLDRTQSAMDQFFERTLGKK